MMCFWQNLVIGIQISPHLVEEVKLKEHLATIGEVVLNFPAKLPSVVETVKQQCLIQAVGFFKKLRKKVGGRKM